MRTIKVAIILCSVFIIGSGLLSRAYAEALKTPAKPSFESPSRYTTKHIIESWANEALNLNELHGARIYLTHFDGNDIDSEAEFNSLIDAAKNIIALINEHRDIFSHPNTFGPVNFRLRPEDTSDTFDATVQIKSYFPLTLDVRLDWSFFFSSYDDFHPESTEWYGLKEFLEKNFTRSGSEDSDFVISQIPSSTAVTTGESAENIKLSTPARPSYDEPSEYTKQYIIVAWANEMLDMNGLHGARIHLSHFDENDIDSEAEFNSVLDSVINITQIIREHASVFYTPTSFGPVNFRLRPEDTEDFVENTIQVKSLYPLTLDIRLDWGILYSDYDDFNREGFGIGEGPVLERYLNWGFPGSTSIIPDRPAADVSVEESNDTPVVSETSDEEIDLTVTPEIVESVPEVIESMTSNLEPTEAIDSTTDGSSTSNETTQDSEPVQSDNTIESEDANEGIESIPAHEDPNQPVEIPVQSSEENVAPSLNEDVAQGPPTLEENSQEHVDLSLPESEQNEDVQPMDEETQSLSDEETQPEIIEDESQPSSNEDSGTAAEDTTESEASDINQVSE